MWQYIPLHILSALTFPRDAIGIHSFILLCFQEEIVLKLIRWTIITDTSNLSPAKKKATKLDIEILEQIENILAESAASMWNRKDIYQEIIQAKGDISSFSANQLLRKDMKVPKCSQSLSS